MSLFSTKYITLDLLRKPVEQELKTFDKYFRESIRSQVALVDLITRYLVRQKGKRVRPLLVLLSAQMCGGITERTYQAASLIEILHTATLVHDDVVDGADTRRGVASINAIWKNKVAVLMGDYLLSRGLLLTLQNKEYHFLEVTSLAVKRMSEGELLQIQKSRQLNTDEVTYLRIISDKTASLFSACTEIGAASTTDNLQKCQSLRLYGENVGVIFQIIDDVLDFTGRRNILGKPIAIDIKEKKLTLPLIYSLGNSEPSLSNHALHVIKRGAKHKDILWIFDFVRDTGGIDYALRKAESFAVQAKDALGSFPQSDAKQSLLKFVDFVIQRDR